MHAEALNQYCWNHGLWVDDSCSHSEGLYTQPHRYYPLYLTLQAVLSLTPIIIWNILTKSKLLATLRGTQEFLDDLLETVGKGREEAVKKKAIMLIKQFHRTCVQAAENSSLALISSIRLVYENVLFLLGIYLQFKLYNTNSKEYHCKVPTLSADEVDCTVPILDLLDIIWSINVICLIICLILNLYLLVHAYAMHVADYQPYFYNNLPFGDEDEFNESINWGSIWTKHSYMLLIQIFMENSSIMTRFYVLLSMQPDERRRRWKDRVAAKKSNLKRRHLRKMGARNKGYDSYASSYVGSDVPESPRGGQAAKSFTDFRRPVDESADEDSRKKFNVSLQGEAQDSAAEKQDYPNEYVASRSYANEFVADAEPPGDTYEIDEKNKTLSKDVEDNTRSSDKSEQEPSAKETEHKPPSKETKQKTSKDFEQKPPSKETKEKPFSKPVDACSKESMSEVENSVPGEFVLSSVDSGIGSAHQPGTQNIQNLVSGILEKDQLLSMQALKNSTKKSISLDAGEHTNTSKPKSVKKTWTSLTDGKVKKTPSMKENVRLCRQIKVEAEFEKTKFFSQHRTGVKRVPTKKQNAVKNIKVTGSQIAKSGDQRKTENHQNSQEANNGVRPQYKDYLLLTLTFVVLYMFCLTMSHMTSLSQSSAIIW